MDLEKIEECFDRYMGRYNIAIFDLWGGKWLGNDNPIEDFKNKMITRYNYHLIDTWDYPDETFFTIVDPDNNITKTYVCTREAVDYEECGTGENYQKLITWRYYDIMEY